MRVDFLLELEVFKSSKDNTPTFFVEAFLTMLLKKFWSVLLSQRGDFRQLRAIQLLSLNFCKF